MGPIVVFRKHFGVNKESLSRVSYYGLFVRGMMLQKARWHLWNENVCGIWTWSGTTPKDGILSDCDSAELGCMHVLHYKSGCRSIVT